MPRPVESQRSLKNGFRRLHRMHAWSLEDKIEYSHRRIERALDRHQVPAVCWSGGKDSTVLLHLVRQHQRDIFVIFNDSGVEFPETRSYVRDMRERWKLNLQIARPNPGERFWDITKEYGWPILGKEQSDNIEKARRRLENYLEALPPRRRKQIKASSADPEILADMAGFNKLSDLELTMVSAGVEVSSRCCLYLKEKPTRILEEKMGVDCKILGLMASESRRRALNWIDYGDYYYRHKYFNTHTGIWKLLPLSIWTEEDIWAYHRKYRIPHCRLYDLGHDRNGCWTCGMGVRYGQLQRLRHSHPKLFRFLMTESEMGRELLRAKTAMAQNIDQERLYDWVEEVNIGSLLEERPCYFDTL